MRQRIPDGGAYSFSWQSEKETEVAMHIYCLFCQTQRAKKIAELMENCGLHRAFTPQVVCRHRVQGEMKDQLYDLLPGYLFLFSETAVRDFSDFRWITGIGHQIGRREDRFELVGSDRTFAQQLYEVNGVVHPMKLVHEGETVKLLDPLFENNDGVITKIEYKKQRARVEFSFDNERWITWVAVDELRL